MAGISIYPQGFPGSVELDLLLSSGCQLFFACLHVGVYAFAGDCDVTHEGQYRNLVFWREHWITLFGT